MEFQPLILFILASLTFLASHATLIPDVYWNTTLPNTPMPKTIKDLFSSGFDANLENVSVVDPNGPKNRAAYVGELSYVVAYEYLCDAHKDEVQNYNPSVGTFFLRKELYPGSRMNLTFVKRSSTPVTLLPREVSELIPFSSKQIPEIYKKFSIEPNATEAKIIKRTIKGCERPGIKGEEKWCATSLESMIDFSISKLGKNIRAISTEIEKDIPMQKCTVVGVKKLMSDKAVFCHNVNYVYTVFYCHKTPKAEIFEVSFVGANGTKVNALAVCHKDTSEWNPKHLAFQILKIKQGTVPVCHFLPENHIVWITKYRLQ